MRKDILDRKDEILKMIQNHEPKSMICKLLKCKYSTLNGWLLKMGIEYSGNMGLAGKKSDPKRKSSLEYLKSSHIKSPVLRRKLIEDGIKKDECEMCAYSMWMGRKLALELHHIDGNHFNNELSNLQILCPNCHSLTPNHSKKK